MSASVGSGTSVLLESVGGSSLVASFPSTLRIRLHGRDRLVEKLNEKPLRVLHYHRGQFGQHNPYGNEGP